MRRCPYFPVKNFINPDKVASDFDLPRKKYIKLTLNKCHMFVSCGSNLLYYLL